LIKLELKAEQIIEENKELGENLTKIKAMFGQTKE